MFYKRFFDDIPGGWLCELDLATSSTGGHAEAPGQQTQLVSACIADSADSATASDKLARALACGWLHTTTSFVVGSADTLETPSILPTSFSMAPLQCPPGTSGPVSAHRSALLHLRAQMGWANGFA